MKVLCVRVPKFSSRHDGMRREPTLCESPMTDREVQTDAFRAQFRASVGSNVVLVCLLNSICVHCFVLHCFFFSFL